MASRTVTDPAALVLVVEDDAAIGRPLSAALQTQGHDVLWAITAHEALELAAAEPPDVVLLDLGLPDLDGIELCQRLRRAVPDVVVVVLSARADDVDVVLGLEAGADDYLTKPFRLPVLLARVRAHVRRRHQERHGARDRLVRGDLVVDVDARTCTVAGAEVPLRPRELDLLIRLAGDAGRAVSREQIMHEVWNSTAGGPTKTLDMHISTLRQKLEDAGLRPVPITTLRGFGYRFDPVGGPGA